MELSNFNKIQELKDLRAANLAKMDDLVRSANEANEGKGEPVADDVWKRYNNEGNDLDKRIQQLEAIELQKREAAALEIENKAKQGEAKSDNENRNRPNDPKNEYTATFDKYLRSGLSGLTNEERKLMLQEQRGTGNQTTTTTAGGFTIPEGFSNQLEVQMLAYGGVRAAATILRTETGNAIPWPTVNDTAVTGALLSEGTADTVSDMTFAEKTLNAYTYSSNTVKVSLQLLQDSYFNLPAFLSEALAIRIARATNAAYTTGDGSSKPNGFITACSTGKTAAAVAAITRAEIVDLIHSVDPAYRIGSKVGFQFNDSVLSAIKQLSIGSADDRPLWQPSITVGEPDRLEGYQYWINQDMDSLATANDTMAFGDFSKYVVRDAGNVTMIRLDERFMDALLVGFMGYLRTDGELIQTAAIKKLTQA